MKIIFKLWGFHPDYLRNKLDKYPWVVKEIEIDPNSLIPDDNNDCLSFLPERTRSTTIAWADYKLRRLK